MNLEKMGDFFLGVLSIYRSEARAATKVFAPALEKCCSKNVFVCVNQIFLVFISATVGKE
jgi:hypothetical protein